MKVDEPFGNETDDFIRIKSSREYWNSFENDANKFWKDALEIARETRETSTDDLLDKLYNHFKDTFQCFKFEQKSAPQLKVN